MKNLFTPSKFVEMGMFMKNDPSRSGNVFVVMGRFQDTALRQGWTQSDVQVVLDQAMSGDYDNLIETINAHIDENLPW